LAESAGIDFDSKHHGYPHFFFIDDQPVNKGDWACYDLKGEDIRTFVNYAFTSDVESLQPGENQNTSIHTPHDVIDCVITCVSMNHFRVSLSSAKAGLAITWLRELSDGYVSFDPDLLRRMPGPIYIAESDSNPVTKADGVAISETKPYAIGLPKANEPKALPSFDWVLK
jgi:glycine hydroxymethyltransferase